MPPEMLGAAMFSAAVATEHNHPELNLGTAINHLYATAAWRLARLNEAITKNETVQKLNDIATGWVVGFKWELIQQAPNEEAAQRILDGGTLEDVAYPMLTHNPDAPSSMIYHEKRLKQ